MEVGDFDFWTKYSDHVRLIVSLLQHSKFVDLLIAMETGTIKDENKIIKWPGSTDTTLYEYRLGNYN